MAKTPFALFAGFSGSPGGGVYLSTDGGKHWVQASTGLPESGVTGLAPIGSKVFAATDGQGVFVTTDNGARWTQVNDYLISWHIASLSAIDTVLFAGPMNFGVFCSTNYGARWYPGRTDGPGLSTATVTSYFQKDSMLFAGTASRGVFRSLDPAQTWTNASNGLPFQSYVTGFAHVGSSLFTAVSYEGVFHSDDGGLLWQPASRGLGVNSLSCLGCVRLPGQKAMLLAGTTTGGLFASSDTGGSWQSVPLGRTSSSLIGSLAVYDSAILLGIGQAVALSTDGGKRWEVGDTLLAERGVNGLAITGQKLFVGTGSAGIYTTANRGQLWTQLKEGLTTLRITAMAASGTTVYAGTPFGNVFRLRETDGRWVDVRGAAFALQYIHTLAVSNGTLFVGAGEMGVYYTTDGGTSWAQGAGSRDAGAGTEILAITSDSQYLYAGAKGQGVYRSSDSGKSWQKYNVGLTDLNVQALAVSHNTLVVAGTPTGLFTSADQGANWNRRGSQNVTSLLAVDNRNIIVAGIEGRGTVVSTDGGTCWQEVNIGIAGSTVRVLAADAEYVYAGVAFGEVYRCELYKLVPPPTFFSERKAELPERFTLTNYPNPFNPRTTIAFSLPKGGRARLAVYDLLGREVQLLIDQILPPGIHTVEFEAGQLASGFYLARLEGGGRTSLAKLLLAR